MLRYLLVIEFFSEPVDENAANITFIQWLASVTERINQTMHFQFSGKPDPLVFHVPQVDFLLCYYLVMKEIYIMWSSVVCSLLVIVY
jgi:hypothetical protein